MRRYEFLARVTVSLLAQRRETRPFGMAGGAPGAPGRNTVLPRGAPQRVLPHRVTLDLAAGDPLQVETPGGGGFGKA